MSKAALHHIATRLLATPWLIKSDTHMNLVAQFKTALQERGADSVRLKLDKVMDDDDYPTRRQAPQADALHDVEIVDGVAVLEIQGILGKHLSLLDTVCGGYDLINLEAKVQALMHRTDVHTVLTHWNTPGGAAAGVAETAEILLEMGTQKRHLAYCTEACSGGYWLASTAQEILCGSSGVLGSISAVCAVEDLSQYYADMGIKVDVFTDGDQKGAGIPGTSLSDTQRRGIQERINHIGGMFKNAVQSRRPKVGPELMQGQWFYGDTCLQNGLADSYCVSLPDALAYALAGRE